MITNNYPGLPFKTHLHSVLLLTVFLCLFISQPAGAAFYDYLSEEEKAWLARHPVIEIGVDGDWAPIDFMDGLGQHRGITAEYLSRLEKLLYIRFIPQQSQTFQHMLDKVKSGELSIGATITPNTERQRFLWFTEPYFYARRVIYVRDDNTDIHKVGDLNNKTIAIESGFASVKQIRQHYPEIKMMEVENTRAALKALSWGQVDAYIGNQAVTEWVMGQLQLANLRIVGEAGLPAGPQAFAISRQATDWQPFVGILDKAMMEIDTQQRQAIERRWMSRRTLDQFKPDTDIQLTENEQDWILQNPVLRVGVDPAWAPVEYLDDEGRYLGIASDFMGLIARRTGLTLDIQKDLSWVQVIEQAKAGKIDILPAVVASPERHAYLDFTDAYLDFKYFTFIREDGDYIDNITELSGKRVAVESGYVTEEFLRNDYPDIEIVVTQTTYQALTALSTGDVDAYIGSLAIGSYLLTEYGISNIKVVSPVPFNNRLSIGVRKNEPMLRGILQKALDSISETERADIRKRWLSVHLEQKLDYKKLWEVILLAVIVVALLAWWALRERKRNQLIRQSEQRLELALDGGDLGLWDVDFKKHTTVVNARWQSLMGYEVSLVIDDPRQIWKQGIHEDDYARVRQCGMAYIMGETDIYDIEYRINTPAGDTRWLLSRGRAVSYQADGTVRRMAGTVMDITPLKQLQLDLQQAQVRADTANQAKSEFLANMSHEIRTPLNAIIGLTYLTRQTRLSNQQLDYLAKIDGSSRTLLGIINDILDFSKIEAGKLELEHVTFSLYEDVLESIASIIGLKAAEKSLDLYFDLPDDLPCSMVGDPLHLEQVLLNLLNNAVKFTHQGHVTLRVTTLQQADGNVRLGFAIEDSGIGLTTEQQASVFEAFAQADSSTTRQYGGTGLGLVISQKLCRLMGTEISVSSEQGKGSIFSFELDYAVDDSLSAATDSAEPVNFSGKRVLVIEDKAPARLLLERYLRGYGCLVQGCSDYQSAIDYIDSTDCYDMIMFSNELYHAQQQGIIQACRNKPCATSRIILMSTHYAQKKTQGFTVHGQVDGVLMKPVSPSALLNVLQSGFLSIPPPQAIAGRVDISDQLWGARILLVEDNEINQQVARDILRLHAFHVVVVNNGQEAIDAFRTDENGFDAILMDVHMPVMDGYAACRVIREEDNAMPIIAMTASAFDKDRQQALAAGMNDHISKPVDITTMFRVLEKWVVSTHAPNLDAISTEDRTLPQKLPGISIREGLLRVGGSPSAFSRLLMRFEENERDFISRLNEVLVRSDIEQAIRLCHTMKGVAATLGLVTVNPLVAQIEMNLRHGQTVDETLLDAFADAMQQVLAGIVRWRLEESEKTKTISILSDLEAPEKVINQLESLLAEQDASAQDIVQKLLPFIVSQHDIEQFEAIRNEIHRQDYARAASILAEMKSRILL